MHLVLFRPRFYHNCNGVMEVRLSGEKCYFRGPALNFPNSWSRQIAGPDNQRSRPLLSRLNLPL